MRDRSKARWLAAVGASIAVVAALSGCSIAAATTKARPTHTHSHSSPTPKARTTTPAAAADPASAQFTCTAIRRDGTYLVEQRDQRREQAVGAVAGSGHLGAVEHLAGVVDHTGGQLGAADVDRKHM